jgi:DNA-binding MurR/RpiR family transcriptional regulator
MSDPGSTERAQSWLVGLAHEHRVSPTQRRVIQHMLASLPGVAFASTIEVAEAAGVSQPTVTRLASALGYAGYPEFRNAMREIVLSPDSAPESGWSPPSSALGSEQQNLAELERMIDSAPMRRAVDLLAATQPLGIIGLRASSALADYLGYFAARVLPDVHVLKDSASMDDDILQLHQNGATAVLAFVMPRYPAATVRALSCAHQLGMSTVAIVDSPLIPFASEVDALLVAPVGTDLVFDSHASAVVLAISLLDALASRDPHRTQDRLEAHEEFADRWVYPER